MKKTNNDLEENKGIYNPSSGLSKTHLENVANQTKYFNSLSKTEQAKIMAIKGKFDN